MMTTYSLMRDDWEKYKQHLREKQSQGGFYVAEDGGTNEWFQYLFDDVPMEA